MIRSIVFFVCSLFVVPIFASAENIVWSELQPDLIMPTESGFSTNPSLYLVDSMVQISYSIAVSKVDEDGVKIEPLQSGASVPIGTRVLLEFVPHEYTDVYWTGTGGAWGTPYGEWTTTGAAPPWNGRCSPKNLYSTSIGGGPSDYYGLTLTGHLFAALSVRAPQKDVAVNGTVFTCSASGAFNKSCVATASGSANAQFTFQATTGEFYPGQYYTGGAPSGLAQPSAPNDCSPNSMEWGSGSMVRWSGVGKSTAGDYTLHVPAQSIPFSLTVSGDDESGQPPATPTLSSGAACIVGSPHTITMSATDPDGDNIRYGIDWNADGTADEFVPPSGYVPSGTAQSASRTYSMAGEKTVRATAQDEGGHTSGWATVTFNCAGNPAVAQGDDGEDQQASNQCLPAYVCRGNDLYQRTGPQCTDETFVQSCSYACSAGACLLPPLASGDITATPPLVPSCDITRVQWTTTRMREDSCTIVEDNPDIADSGSGPSGSFLSSPILRQTTFTLACTREEGGLFTDTATVNIVPVFQEE